MLASWNWQRWSMGELKVAVVLLESRHFDREVIIL
jgi:hypothetical protein